MPWSEERLAKIPEVYRDFMITLKPVIDSRTRVMSITGIPIDRIYSFLSDKYECDVDEVVEIGRGLAEQGFVQGPDTYGFYVPSAKGEELILALCGRRNGKNSFLVPPLPQLLEAE